jgi:hypothetical protein
MRGIRIVVWLAVALLGASPSRAADRMIGVVPTDGVTSLVKEFAVEAGTSLVGVQLENNDPATTFPEVTLLRGPMTAVSEGEVVASDTGVQVAAGTVILGWASPVAITEGGTYYVRVRFPAGPGKQGVGHGPALGANNVSEPNGSYVTCGTGGSLLPVKADLVMTLVTSGGSMKAGGGTPAGQSPGSNSVAFLSVRWTGASATIEFRLPHESMARLAVYDVSGRLVQEVTRGALPSGTYARLWDGRDRRGGSVSAGVYLVRLETPGKVLTGKVILAR